MPFHPATHQSTEQAGQLGRQLEGQPWNRKVPRLQFPTARRPGRSLVWRNDGSTCTTRHFARAHGSAFKTQALAGLAGLAGLAALTGLARLAGYLATWLPGSHSWPAAWLPGWASQGGEAGELVLRAGFAPERANGTARICARDARSRTPDVRSRRLCKLAGLRRSARPDEQALSVLKPCACLRVSCSAGAPKACQGKLGTSITELVVTTIVTAGQSQPAAGSCPPHPPAAELCALPDRDLRGGGGVGDKNNNNNNNNKSNNNNHHHNNNNNSNNSNKSNKSINSNSNMFPPKGGFLLGGCTQRAPRRAREGPRK